MKPSAAVIPLAKPDPAAALREQRASVVASLADADRKLARLAEAEEAERQAFAAIGALGEREIEAVKVWVAAGCEGPQPKPDAAERQRLADALAEATRANAAAKAAAVDVGGEARTLRSRLASIDAELRTLALAALEREFAELVDDWSRKSSDARAALALIRGLPWALIEAGRERFARGDEARARALYSAAERMRARPLAEIEPGDDEIARALAPWRGRIEGLSK